MQRLAAIVYWPYPPVHFLNRRLAMAREEVCDNYVLREGDAPSYAETLLAISQSIFSKRLHPAALGLFHPFGKLERRVASLLDPRRNVMVRTHRVTLALLATLFVVAAVAVAGTRLLQAEPPASVTVQPPVVERKTPAKSTPAADVSQSIIEPGDVLTIHAVGTLRNQPIDGLYLVGPDGKVNLGAAYGTVNISRLSIEQAERKIADHLKKIVTEDDVDVRYAIAAAEVARADYEHAVDANKRVKNTVPQAEVRKRLLEWKKMELAVEKARKASNPAVQVTLSRKGGGAWGKAELPKASYKIGVYDVLQVRVVGTLRDQPIDGYFLIEAEGTLALGPAYGRVAVKGLTLDAAEKAINKKLREVLQKPEVQVTLARSAEQKEPWREIAPPKKQAEPVSQTLPSDPSSDASLNIIQPSDVLRISVMGTLVDYPIDNFFLVEPDGKVPLGPVYGRVNIAGLTWEQAEKRIVEHLEKILDHPEIQLTLPDREVQLTSPRPEAQVTLVRRTTASREAARPRLPYKITAWDVLGVCAVFTVPDHPIDGYCLVEPSGQVALGPAYGRVDVNGLTCEQAEKKIVRHLKKRSLSNPAVQVVLARRGEPWREAVLPKLPYKIGVWDVVQVRVLGTLIDQPIDNYFLVESTGTLALGPTYGRVQVKGLSLGETEAAIRKKLEKVIEKPEVCVTWARSAAQEKPWRETTPPKAPYAIKPGMLLSISVLGTLLDQPINGTFTVEQTGAVALGPAYGRVQVDGLTLDAAEKAIQKKLEEVLKSPRVQATFAGWQREDAPLGLGLPSRRTAKVRSTQLQNAAEKQEAKDRDWWKKLEWEKEHGPKLPPGSLR